MPFRLIFAICALGLASGCCSYSPDSPPGLDLASPQRTVEYLQWAFENEFPLHVARCFSQEFMDEQDFDASQLEFFWEDVKETVLAQIGEVQKIQIVKIEDVDTSGALKDLYVRAGNRQAVVRFKLATYYEISHRRPTKDSVYADVPGMATIMSYDGDTAVLRLPGVANPKVFAPKNLHKIVIESSWLIRSVTGAETNINHKQSPSPQP